MRLYQMASMLTKQFVPLDPATAAELDQEATVSYAKEAKAATEAKDRYEFALRKWEEQPEEERGPKPLPDYSMKQKIFLMLEMWQVRYLLAILFIFIPPMLKEWINKPRDLEEEEEEGQDFEADMEMLRMMRKMRK